MPTEVEIRLRRRADESFPSTAVFRRMGSKLDVSRAVANYCEGRADCDDVLAILRPAVDAPQPPTGADVPDDAPRDGFVYLMKSGRYCKIGQTNDVGRRRYDLAIQLPQPIGEVHVIATDDPVGIERYWHGRFKDRRMNGEWFELTAQDVAAFKRRRFM